MPARPIAEPPQPASDLAHILASLSDARGAAEGTHKTLLPRQLHDLTPIQRAVLTRAAVHAWTHDGTIPFIPPTDAQRAVAWDLHDLGILHCYWVERGDDFLLAFRLNRLGDAAARRVLHVVSAPLDQAREREYDRILALMRRNTLFQQECSADNDEPDETGGEGSKPIRAHAGPTARAL